jgi:acetyl esterase
MMHMHIGGWAISSEDGQDVVLKKIADNSSLLVISIGYRLAPEDSFQRAQTIASTLRSGSSRMQSPPSEPNSLSLAERVLAVTSRSLTALHLLHSPKYFSFKLRGLLLHYGCYDLSCAPTIYNFKPSRTLLIDATTVRTHLADFCPGMSMEDLKNPNLSPLYADLAGLQLSTSVVHSRYA